MSKARDIADLDFNAPDIDGGNIDGAVIGGTTPAAGSFSQVNVDNITMDGTTLALSSGDLTLDAVAGDIVLDAHGNQILFKGSSGQIGFIDLATGRMDIKASNADADMRFQGNDGGVAINALTLDMSNAGAATFNSNITFGDGHSIGNDADDNLQIAGSSGENIIVKSTEAILLRTGGDTNALTLNQSQDATFAGTITANAGISVDNFTLDGTSLTLSTGNMELFTSGSNHDILFKGNDGGSTITALQLDMSAAGAATFSGDVTLAAGKSLTLTSGMLEMPTNYKVRWGGRNKYSVFSDNANYVIVKAADQEAVRFGNTESVFNNGGDDRDFRVASDANSHALFVDASTSRIGINESSPEAPLHVSGDAIIEGFTKKAQGPTQSSPSFSTGDWITLATVAYGRALGEVGVYWNGLSAPTSAHHGYQRLKVGAFYNSYYYGWETTLEHLDHQAHNTFYFTEFRIIRPDGYTNGTPQLLQGKVNANVTAGQFAVYIENQLGPNATDITPVLPAVDNTPNGNTVQASLTVPARGAKAIYGAFSANGIIYSETGTPEFYLRDTSSGGTASLNLDGTELTLRNNSTNGALKLETNNPREEFVYINGTAFYSESFNMLNGTQYDFDIDVPSEGGFGNSFFIIAGYNHYHATAYAAHKIAFMSTRGTYTGTMIDVGNQQSTGGGAWQFSKADNTTLRIRKTAGTYVGSGSGFITVIFRNAIGN